MKTVEFSRDARKSLRTHANMAARCRAAVLEYAANPAAHANRVTKLVGSSAMRMRVGDYRVIFEETDVEIIVTKIGPRGSVYD